MYAAPRRYLSEPSDAVCISSVSGASGFSGGINFCIEFHMSVISAECGVAWPRFSRSDSGVKVGIVAVQPAWWWGWYVWCVFA